MHLELGGEELEAPMSVGLTSESEGQNSDWAPYASTEGHGPSNTGMQLSPEVEELMLAWPASLRYSSWLYYRASKEGVSIPAGHVSSP